MNCSDCNNPGATKRCGTCHVSFYCDIDCQRSWWPTHKKACSLALRVLASPRPVGFVDVLIATGDKNTTRFERIPQEPGTETHTEPSCSEIVRLIGPFEVVGLGATADAYCNAKMFELYHEKFNGSARTLLPTLDLKPYTIHGPMLVSFREGICRLGRTSLQLALIWYECFMAREVGKMLIYAHPNDEDRERHAGVITRNLTSILGVFGQGLSPDDDNFKEMIKHEIANDALKWELPF